MSARAGWFPDPAGFSGHYRWWDGSAWTRFLTADPTAPEPFLSANQAGEPDDSDHPAPQRTVGPAPDELAGAVVVAETSAAPGPRQRPPGYERLPRSDRQRHSSLKPALLGTGAVALLAVIVLAVVLVGSPTPPSLQPPPPAHSRVPSPTRSPTSGGNRPGGSFDQLTRKFVLDGVQITLPAAPYAITRPGGTDLGGPGGGARADAVVHKNYNGRGSDWDAAVEIDHVGPAMRGKTLNETADKIIATWAASAFAGDRAAITNEKKSTITKGEPRPARIITADLHYKVKNLTSRYDHVSLLVTTGRSGDYVAFISSRPNDAGPKIKTALKNSINTLRLV